MTLANNLLYDITSADTIDVLRQRAISTEMPTTRNRCAMIFRVLELSHIVPKLSSTYDQLRDLMRDNDAMRWVFNEANMAWFYENHKWPFAYETPCPLCEDWMHVTR